MAEEQSATTPVDAQTTTAPEASTEAAPEATSTTNGTADPTAEATPAEGETELTKDDVATAGEQATTEVNAPDGEGKTAVVNAPSDDAAATPASTKGKRKSTSGVPEHKGKKLNKKKSTVNLNLDIQEGDYYWARLKGYPPWPSIVCDEEMLPEVLLATRPVSAKRPDGSYREDFLDEGKNARDRTYAVMFLGTNEFSWMVNTNLTKLEPGECASANIPAKMTKSLKDAYNIAEERHDLDYFHKMLEEHAEQQKTALEEQIRKDNEKQEKAAKAAAKADKKNDKTAPQAAKEKKEKRKSTSKSKDTVSEEDEMEVDATEGAESKPSKKRKKDAESEGEGPKPKKTPKVKLAAAKTTNGDSAKKTPKTKKVVTKPEKEVEKEVLTEEQKLDRRQIAVLYLRHRLQKGFLTRDQAPKEEEMTAMSEHFTQLEELHDLEAKIIRETKIHKVLRAIIKLDSIPKDDELKFKSRSKKLLEIWDKTLDSQIDEAKAAKTAAPAEVPATNGDAAAKTEEPSKEPSAAPVEAADPGNDAKDEADGDLTMIDAKDEKPTETEATEASESAEPAADATATEAEATAA